MPYILECRVNAKERLMRISDIQGKELQRLQLDNKLPPVLALNGETLQSASIQLISPEHTWFEHDKKALASKGHQRCPDCLTVKPFGEMCCVRRANPLKDEPEYLKDVKPLTEAQLRRGWVIALKAAKQTSSTHWMNIGASIMRRYGIRLEEI